MKCKSVITWLHQVETLQVKEWPRNMNRHLKRCAECAKVARLLYKIEDAWRNQPVPESCEQARVAFLEKLGTLEPSEKPVKREKPRRERRPNPVRQVIPVRPWHPLRWVAVAAVLLLGIGAALFWPSETRASSSDLIERLVDWDLEMANAEPAERKRLFDEKEPGFRKDLQQSNLSEEDRELAEELLDDGRKLVAATDLVAEAEVIKRITDKLFASVEKADERKNDKEFEGCSKRYMNFKLKVYDPLHLKVTDPKKGHESCGTPGQREQIERIFRRPPDQSRPDLHKKIEIIGKKGGPPKGGKK